jgi:hypothetical protein
MTILRLSANDPQNREAQERYAKWSLKEPQLRCLPFIPLTEKAQKQLATVFKSYATLANSNYWISFVNHIVAFSLPFSGESEMTDMGFPTLQDSFHLFTTFEKQWTTSAGGNAAYLLILQCMLTLDTFSDYVSSQLDMMQETKISPAQQLEIEKRISALAGFPATQVRLVTHFLRDSLFNCGSVPFACRYLLEIIQATHNFIGRVEDTPKPVFRSGGKKHHVTLNRGLKDEVKQFNLVVREVKKTCSDELRELDKILEK